MHYFARQKRPFQFGLGYVIFAVTTVCIAVYVLQSVWTSYVFSSKIQEDISLVESGGGSHTDYEQSRRISISLKSATQVTVMSPVVADARIFSSPNGREAWLYIDWIARDKKFKAIELVFNNGNTKQIFSDEISTGCNSNFYLNTAIPLRKIFANMQRKVELSSVIIVVDDKKSSNEFSVRKSKTSNKNGSPTK